MPELTVHTLKHAITIRCGNQPLFQFLAGAPRIPTALVEATIDVKEDGTFLSAVWCGVVPAFLTRTASARDLVLQLDSEFAELSLRDAQPDTTLSASILHWRGRRLLLLGPGLTRTAIALALFPREVDIEGDWACRLSSRGLTALPRSVRWDARLLQAYPQVSAQCPSHAVDSFHGELRAWCPFTETRPWICRDGRVDGIVVTENNAGGRSLSRRIAPDFTWGHLMAARTAGAGGATVMIAMKNLATSTPALKLSVGDLTDAAHRITEFLVSLPKTSSPIGNVAQYLEV